MILNKCKTKTENKSKVDRGSPANNHENLKESKKKKKRETNGNKKDDSFSSAQKI